MERTKILGLCQTQNLQTKRLSYFFYLINNSMQQIYSYFRLFVYIFIIKFKQQLHILNHQNQGRRNLKINSHNFLINIAILNLL